MVTDSLVTVFTDGASRGNPGPGGWGAVVVCLGEGASDQTGPASARVVELGGREEKTTNNKMELTAAIKALSYLSTNQHWLGVNDLIVYTDSSYLIKGITGWVFGWIRNDWCTKVGQPVANRELWQELTQLTEGREISWRHVSGHSGVAGNERADEIATGLADGKPPRLYDIDLKNYPYPELLEPLPVTAQPAGSAADWYSNFHRRQSPYSYVSLVNGEIRTHRSWPECQKRVSGAKGAKYKKVFSSAEEQGLIRKWQGRS